MAFHGYQLAPSNSSTEIMDVVPCIFCGTEDNLTDEHVFPAFMGGTLSVRNGSCAPHNSLCSRFEDKVASATQVLRNLLGIENRKSIVPNAAVTMSSEGFDFPAMRTPDGDVIPFEVWLIAPMPWIITTSLWMKLQPIIGVAYSLGWLAKLIPAAVAVALILR